MTSMPTMYCESECVSFSQDSWIKVVVKSQGGVLPKPRRDHTATVIGDKFVIIGGTTVDDALLSDVWMFNTKQVRFNSRYQNTWEMVLATGNSITGLSGHGAQLDQQGRIIIYGGIQDDGTQSSTVYILDFLAKKWTTPTIGLNPGTIAPQEREGFVTAYFNNRFFIFGGRNSTGYTSDLYALDTKTLKWSEGFYEKALFVSPPRQQMAFARSGRILLVCGGCNSGLNQCYGNCFMLDLSSMDVNRISFFNPNPISPTQGASMALYGGTMLYFGGCDFLKSCSNQLVIFNTGNMCPEKCFNRGVCDSMSLGRCKCDPGFWGNSCMYTTKCQNNCNNAGSCLGFQVCSCYPGYTGVSCQTKVNCPGNCTSAMQGTCLTNGTCHCNTFYNSTPDCSVDSRHKAATSLITITQTSTNQTDPHLHRVSGRFVTPSTSSSSKVDISMTCPDSCSNVGICISGKCYCQPGYGGQNCGINLNGNVNSGVRVKTILIYFIGVFVFGFIMGSFLCRYFIVRSLSNEYELVSAKEGKHFF